MLRCALLARNALRAPTRDLALVTRTAYQLHIEPIHASRSASTPGQCYATSLRRAYATATAKKTAKRPATRKTTKSPARKTAKKAAPKKKKAAAKKKPAPRKKAKKIAKKKPVAKKRVLSERQKLLLQKKQAREALAKLKATALLEPKGKPESTWVVFLSERVKATSGPLPERAKLLSSEYKSLSPAELQNYTRIARENKASNDTAYAAWVRQHTPEQIRLANNARRLLKRKGKKDGNAPYGRGLTLIEDERQVKRPTGGYITFANEKRSNGDYSNLSFRDLAKAIKQDWENLGAQGKKKYNDLQEADRQRYVRDFTRTYNHAPSAARTSAAA